MPRRYNDAIYKDSVGALLQRQSVGTSGNHARTKGGSDAKNFRLDNRASIKAMQAQNKQRRAEEAAPAAEPFKLRQFKNVKSRFASAAAAAATTAPGVTQGQRTPGSADQGAPSSREFLRKGAREKLATELQQEALLRRQEDRYGSAPAVTATGSKLFGATGTSRRSLASSPPDRSSSSSSSAVAAAAAATDKAAAAAASASKGSRGSSRGSDGDRDGRGGGGGGRPNPSENGAPSRGRGAGIAAGCSTAYGGSGGGVNVTPRKEAVPRAGDVAHLAPRSGRDFVAANRMQAVEMKARDVSKQDTAFRHESYGRVPEYLVSRQEEWEREATRREAEAPDPSCPPGMKLMPEEERLQALRQLQENESTCQCQLNKFPLVVQTPLLQRRLDDLHNKLKEIDAAKAIFSRSKVYIARDS